MKKLDEYQKFVWELASEASKKDYQSKLCTAALGLAGEAGECSEIVKKHLFHGKELSIEHFKSELGDCLWYIAFAATILNLDLQDILDANVKKLKDRYPMRKFTFEDFQRKENAK